MRTLIVLLLLFSPAHADERKVMLINDEYARVIEVPIKDAGYLMTTGYRAMTDAEVSAYRDASTKRMVNELQAERDAEQRNTIYLFGVLVLVGVAVAFAIAKYGRKNIEKP